MARTIIGIVNLVILIIIAICCFVGRKVFTDYKLDNIKEFSSQTKYLIAVFVFVAIVCLIGFLMICFGGFKCFRCTYAFFYLVIVIVEIILVALAAKFPGKAKEYAQKHWDQYKNQSAVQEIEKVLKCCGFIEPYNGSEVCGYTPDNETTAPTCWNAVEEKIKSNKKYAMYGGIIILVLQIILFFYAIWYGFCYKDEDEHADVKEGMTAQA